MFLMIKELSAVRFLLLGLFIFVFMPAAAFAETLATVSSFRASAATEFVSNSLNTADYQNLKLSFDFDATTLDFGPPQDNFTYGFRTGGSEYSLGTFLGLAGSTTAELGSIAVDLPLSASASDLVLFISVLANSAGSSDKVELRNIVLSGDLKPVIVDVCPNLGGNQETVPTGYEKDVAGDCTLVSSVSVDICPNLSGLQEAIPAGYEKNTSGDCVAIPPTPADICTNLAGQQTVLPQGYEVNLDGDCVVIPPVPVDICPNLGGLQEVIPAGYEKNTSGDCVSIPPPVVDVCPNISGVQTEIPVNFLLNGEGNCLPAPVSPADMCPNLAGVQEVIPAGQQLNAAGECVVIVVTPPPVPPTPAPKLCPKGYSKWIDKFTERHIWQADDIYQAIILMGGPTDRRLNRDKAHLLYIAGPTEVGDKYYRRYHKITQVCVKG